jgi:hypothetical protein
MKFYFTKEEYDACELFSQAVDTSHYAKRSQNNESKRIKDALIGKLGEVAAYHYLKDKIDGLSTPDFNIYEAKNKSWDFDLKAEGFNIHVKTQDNDIGEKYGTSWIFQYGNGKNSHYDKEIFDVTSPNQYVVFVSLFLNGKDSVANIRAVTRLEFLHQKKMFSLPKLERLQFANKKAVYLKDLEKYPEDMFHL